MVEEVEVAEGVGAVLAVGVALVAGVVEGVGAALVAGVVLVAGAVPAAEVA